MYAKFLFFALLALVLGACALPAGPSSSLSPAPPKHSPQKAAPAPAPATYPMEIPPQEARFASEALPGEVAEKITGASWVENDHIALEHLSLLTVAYLGFDGKTYLGQMVVNATVAQELTEIFAELYENRFPIEKMRLIDEYGADDNLSMADNNSSAFCYRVIDGTEYLSNHSLGLAVDLNPVQNPYVRGELVQPEAGAAYMERGEVRPGMITRGDACYNAFVSRGWSWGGDWSGPIDYQHFEKAQ